MGTDKIIGGPGSYPVTVERDCNTCKRHRQMVTPPRSIAVACDGEVGHDPHPCWLCIRDETLPNWAPLEPHWFSK